MNFPPKLRPLPLPRTVIQRRLPFTPRPRPREFLLLNLSKVDPADNT